MQSVFCGLTGLFLTFQDNVFQGILFKFRINLQQFVELDFGYAVPVPTVIFSNDVREHLLKGRKQTAASAAGKQIIELIGVFCDEFSKGKGGQLVLLRSAWSTHVVCRF